MRTTTLWSWKEQILNHQHRPYFHCNHGYMKVLRPAKHQLAGYWYGSWEFDGPRGQLGCAESSCSGTECCPGVETLPHSLSSSSVRSPQHGLPRQRQWKDDPHCIFNVYQHHRFIFLLGHSAESHQLAWVCRRCSHHLSPPPDPQSGPWPSLSTHS